MNYQSPVPERKARPRKKPPRHRTRRKKKTEGHWRLLSDVDLSESDLETLAWITRYIVSFGYPPCVKEICKARGIKSTLTGFGLLARLEAFGFLDVDPGVPRGIRVHNLPPPDTLGTARLRQWLSEAAGFLRRLAPDDPEVSAFLRKVSVVAF